MFKLVTQSLFHPQILVAPPFIHCSSLIRKLLSLSIQKVSTYDPNIGPKLPHSFMDLSRLFPANIFDKNRYRDNVANRYLLCQVYIKLARWFHLKRDHREIWHRIVFYHDKAWWLNGCQLRLVDDGFTKQTNIQKYSVGIQKCGVFLCLRWYNWVLL